MNKIQKEECKKIKYILRNWRAFEGESYSVTRRFFRKFLRGDLY